MLKLNQKMIEENVFDVDTFKIILGYTQEELKDLLVNKLLPSFYEKENIISKDGFIRVIGKKDIMLLAHMDTVFSTPPTIFIHDKEQGLLTSPHGIGGDDRCGIYGILTLLLAGYRPHILFTEDEEIGGIGADKASKTEVIPDSIKYLIQLDRRGEKDAVYYCCGNSKFHNFIEDYGFDHARGSFTDIDTLMPVWDICGVNLSIGYYNEHNKNEYINLNYMSETLKKVAKMIETLPDEKHEFIKERAMASVLNYDTRNSRKLYQGKTIQEYYASFLDNESTSKVVCDACGNYKDEKEMNSCYGINICDECYALVGKIV